jgi:hypothetical protein
MIASRGPSDARLAELHGTSARRANPCYVESEEGTAGFTPMNQSRGPAKLRMSLAGWTHLVRSNKQLSYGQPTIWIADITDRNDIAFLIDLPESAKVLYYPDA